MSTCEVINCDRCQAIITTENKAMGMFTYGNNKLSGVVPYSDAEGKPRRMLLEVATGRDSEWSDGYFCRNCVIDAVNSLK